MPPRRVLRNATHVIMARRVPRTKTRGIPMARPIHLRFLLLIAVVTITVRAGESDRNAAAPPPSPADAPPQQLPHKMHARMSTLPTIKVGRDRDADITG